MNNNYIWNEILAERAAQDAKHGGIPNDNRNSLVDWVRWIRRHADKVLAPNLPYSPRYQFVRVAALAVAAIEHLDRVYGKPVEQGQEERGAGE